MPLSIRFASLCSVVLLPFSSAAVDAQHAPNTNPTYQQLRVLAPGSDAVAVNNLELVRDAATFTFAHGAIGFYGAVNGKVTGAVFKGVGHFHLTPPTASERRNLSILTRSDVMDEDFDQVVFRFTDDTGAELHKGGSGLGGDTQPFITAAREASEFERRKLLENVDLRLFEDVLSTTQGGYFQALIHGKKNAHLLFRIDPHGARMVSPEEVSVLNWSDMDESFPAAFRSAGNGSLDGLAKRNITFRADDENLDVTIEKGGFLSGIATLHIVAEQDGVAVAPLSLYPTLRVSRVETDKGDALDFVQEKKEEDADFGVMFAHPLKKDEAVTIRITYAGKDVVRNEGGRNYYPIARQSWYPNPSRSLGDYATYHMLFHVPKGLQLVATGTKLSDTSSGKVTTTEWKTDVPLPVVGFNLGSFAMQEGKLTGSKGDSITIDAYVNTEAPDEFSNLADQNLGTFNPKSMLPMQLSQGEGAMQVYAHYFGVLPFTRIALTQQFACNYGQSWPMLVYLPICGFLDQTQQHFLGLHPEDEYWKVVTPHEVAHQWWGQTVGFGSYRDQWMSEGFADASAAIYLQASRPKPDDFHQFWKYERRLLTEKNAQGFRPIDVGPVTMGFRLASTKTGWDAYQSLVYPKGAFILHMIREMMWSTRDGDARFIDMMHDFVKTYWLRPATTEDFKAMVEKHMSPEMDLDKNHKMDWFFDEFVYGTELPVYHFEGQANQQADGTTLHVKLTQSGVSENFKMMVPVYIEFENGNVTRLGSATIKGSSSLEQTIPAGKPPSPIKRLLINYNYDVLSVEK